MKKLLYTLATAGIFAFAANTLAQPRPAPKPNHGPAAKPNHGPAAIPAPKPAPNPLPNPNAKPNLPTPNPAPSPAARPVPGPGPRPVPGPGPRPAPGPGPRPAPGPGPRPAPGPGPHPHPHGPGYRPGFKAYSLPRPFAVDYYRDWRRPTHKQYFTLFDMPEKLQLRLYSGQEFEIKLEEERKEGYSWFARYDAAYVDVDIDHEKGHKNFFGERDRYAEVEIKALRPGASYVELIYANRRDWDNGEGPERVIQVFVLTE